MHRAFLLQEIVHEICAFNTGDLKSLAALARTCRWTHEAATQELWKEITDLVPLFNCFPEDSWSTATGELVFTRSLTPEDWERVFHHSKHVRVISLQRPWPRRSQLHGSALATMASATPAATLFSNVRTFIWNDAGLNIEHVNTILGLLGLRVKYIDVRVPSSFPDESTQRLRDALLLIPRQFPLLEHFGFGKANEDVVRGPPPFPEVALLPQSLQSLTTFCFYNIPTTEDVVYALARLPQLKTLNITLPFNSSWPAEHLPDAFASLRHLSLRMAAADYIAFSAVWRFPNVEHAVLEIVDIPDQSAVSKIFRSVGEQFSVASLRELEINCADICDVDDVLDAESVVRPVHLHPLLAFTGLQRLELNMACQYALDDNFYQDLATSLPRLSTLTIADCDWCPHDSFPSMTALKAFALHRSLHSLSVAFDGTQELSLEDIRNALPPDTRPSRVVRLQVGYSPLKDPQLVATYLTRLFPGAGGMPLEYGELDSDTDEGEERQELWAQAARFFAFFHVIREDERNITTQQLGRRTKRTKKGGKRTSAIAGNTANV